MKTDGTDSAHPHQGVTARGLTKREYMALHLMAAYASADYVANSGNPHEDIALWGVRAADALISALNAEKGGSDA